MGKLVRAKLLIVFIFLSGSYIIYTGFSQGQHMAINIARPPGATGWTTPDQLVLACTYVPVIIGVALIVLSLMFSTVLFWRWINND